jgi:hypothetical protein
MKGKGNPKHTYMTRETQSNLKTDKHRKNQKICEIWKN